VESRARPCRVLLVFILCLRSRLILGTVDVRGLTGCNVSWPNVYTNLKNIDYCTDQFNYIT
jgi:hypothetical protein